MSHIHIRIYMYTMHVGCTSVAAEPIQEHYSGHKAYMTMILASTENNRTLTGLNNDNILPTLIC